MARPIRFGLITVSDSCARGAKEDLSGAELDRLVGASSRFASVVVARLCVADEADQIKEALVKHAADCDVLLTTGGTGLAPRDVTPEATRAVLDREAPGIALALLSHSLSKTPLAALSRLTAGTRGRCLVVNVPGSVKAVKECFEVLEPLLSHAVQLLRDDSAAVAALHSDPRRALP